MRKVFADTGYWIALLNSRDDLHNRAKHLSKFLQPVQIVTSQMVVTEVLNYFSGSGQYLRHASTQLVESLKRNRNAILIPQTSEWFDRGFNLYTRRIDKGWSLTDCVSFEIMEEQQITEALANDIHFEQAGFIALLRNPDRG